MNTVDHYTREGALVCDFGVSSKAEFREIIFHLVFLDF